MNKFVKSILDPIGVPVANKTYLGGEQTYIVFNIWSVPALHADDMEIETEYTVQIDIFSIGNLTNLAKETKDRMINAGFMREYENEEYIEEAKLFRKIIRFNYTKEAE